VPFITNLKSFDFTSLVLSNDGLTLYGVNAERIHIFDVSNYKTPFRVQSFKYKEINDDPYRKYPVAVRNDDKMLFFVTSEGLQVYDVSNKKEPLKVNFIVHNMDLTKILCLALGVDNTLFLVDGGLKAYNVSDIQNIEFLGEFPTNSHATWVMISKD